jgi:hypothetical protein
VLNKAPIFINGFQRGGTNLLMNLVASHPDVCQLSAETHVVFYGRDRQPLKKWLHRAAYAPIALAARQHIFWPYRFYPRNPLPGVVAAYVDLLFYLSKLSAPRNRIADHSRRNTLAEIARSRLLCKNVNGVVLASRVFAAMYPDATFVALVRNGFALCEGFIRRGWTADRFGQMYQAVCQQMLEDADEYDSYRIVRFEDLVSSPVTTIDEIYELAGLDPRAVARYQLQAKKSMGTDGKRQYLFGSRDRERLWFKREELGGCFRTDINENQIARLSAEDKDIFCREAETSMRRLGYACE